MAGKGHCQGHEVSDVAGSDDSLIVESEKFLDELLRVLLTVVDRRIEVRIWSRRQFDCRSKIMLALSSQPLTSSRLNSSVEDFSTLENLADQRCWHAAPALDLGTGLHQNVHRNGEVSKTPVSSHRAQGWRLLAVRHDYQQVQITVLVGSAPGVGSEQDDAIRRHLGNQAPCDFLPWRAGNGRRGAHPNILPGS